MIVVTFLQNAVNLLVRGTLGPEFLSSKVSSPPCALHTGSNLYQALRLTTWDYLVSPWSIVNILITVVNLYTSDKQPAIIKGPPCGLCPIKVLPILTRIYYLTTSSSLNIWVVYYHYTDW